MRHPRRLVIGRKSMWNEWNEIYIWRLYRYLNWTLVRSCALLCDKKLSAVRVYFGITALRKCLRWMQCIVSSCVQRDLSAWIHFHVSILIHAECVTGSSFSYWYQSAISKVNLFRQTHASAGSLQPIVGICNDVYLWLRKNNKQNECECVCPHKVEMHHQLPYICVPGNGISTSIC